MATVAYAEFPYVIRRRRSSDSEGERIRISEELRRIQHDLAYYSSWIATESQAVSDAYDNLVAESRKIAGSQISAAWNTEPIASDDGLSMPDLGLDALRPVRERYVSAVSQHLGSWWSKR